MRRELPIAITFVLGVLIILAFFFDSPTLTNASQSLQNWAVIIAAFALGIASVNLIQVHAKKIARGQDRLDWLYSGALLLGLFGMTVIGLFKGPADQMYQFWFNALFTPGQATVYAMTGFYIASAAFRAFRIRNLEAGILLVSAALVMLGNVSVGEALWSKFPVIGSWLVNVPNLAAQRGMMIGAGIGGIAGGLRVLLGIEKSYLGSGS
ncbi:MAG TPA: hypothetical protein GX500_04490 [Firmicutes bacterium]|nr:hypothetical protein [Candidatus Fermentithermobacillaceae bacterium]